MMDDLARSCFHRAWLLAALLLTGCDPSPQTWEWKQKLTVEVTTPHGVKTGSAVTRVRWGKENSVGNYPSDYQGEATVVDLGGGRFLFALLGEPTKWLGLWTFRDVTGDGGITEAGFAAQERVRGTRDVPRKLYPLLVTFADINDPKSVRKVDPRNLAAAFGAGVKLKRMTLTVTDEKVTEDGIEKVLGTDFFREWAQSTRDALNRGGTKDPYFRTFASEFSRNDFVQE